MAKRRRGPGHPAMQAAARPADGKPARVFDGLAIYPTPAGQIMIGVGHIGRDPSALTLVCPSEVEALVNELREAAAAAGAAHAHGAAGGF